MNVNALRHLIILVGAGMSLEPAIQALYADHPNHSGLKKMMQQLDQGVTLGQVACQMFPWWCRYPYYDHMFFMDTPAFLNVCQRYIDERAHIFRAIGQSLLYPVALFFLGLAILFFVAYGLPQSTSVSDLIMWWIISALILFFSIGCIFLWYMVSSIRFGPYDALFLVQLGLSQGGALKRVITTLRWPKNQKNQWSHVLSTCIDHQSFVVAFCQSFSMPVSFKTSLIMYELSGQLDAGLSQILPRYRDYILHKRIRACQWFKVTIYLFIMGVIFLLAILIYGPTLSYT
jgi:type II secretory pathway component PulF